MASADKVARTGLREFLRYAVTGGCAAVAAYSVAEGLLRAGVQQVWLAQLSGFVPGGALNFWLSKQWVFENKSDSWLVQLAVFYAMGLVGLTINEIASVASRALGVSLWVVPAVGLAAGFAWNFAQAKWITFGIWN